MFLSNETPRGWYLYWIRDLVACHLRKLGLLLTKFRVSSFAPKLEQNDPNLETVQFTPYDLPTISHNIPHSRILKYQSLTVLVYLPACTTL